MTHVTIQNRDLFGPLTHFPTYPFPLCLRLRSYSFSGILHALCYLGFHCFFSSVPGVICWTKIVIAKSALLAMGHTGFSNCRVMAPSLVMSTRNLADSLNSVIENSEWQPASHVRRSSASSKVSIQYSHSYFPSAYHLIISNLPSDTLPEWRTEGSQETMKIINWHLWNGTQEKFVTKVDSRDKVTVIRCDFQKKELHDHKSYL